VGGAQVKRPAAPAKVPPKRRIRVRQIAAGVVVVAAAAGLWGWSVQEAGFEGARERALEYFATRVREADPSWLSLFGYMRRRFGLVATLASGRPADDISAEVQRPEVLEIYRRIEDPMASVDKRRIAALPTAIDRITASALHCDRIQLPDDWIDILRKAAIAGGYALTHSALAAEWTVENGCRSRADLESLRADQIVWLMTLINKRHEPHGQSEATTDVWIEAVAMLYYLGAGDMVRREWLEEIVLLQNDDGGWSRSPSDGRSDPHATALALWVLLEHLERDAPRTAWIAQLG
jgi:hypothetical protein